MGKLTAAKVRAITRTDLHGDGGTLYLSVAPGGSKSWIQRLTVNGRRRDIGLGGFPLVSLAEARERAFDNRRWARAGDDPLAEKRKARVPTFREAAHQVFEANKPRWRSEQHTTNWLKYLERHAMPHIGDMPVDRVGREGVLRILTPLWGTRMETARHLPGRLLPSPKILFSPNWRDTNAGALHPSGHRSHTIVTSDTSLSTLLPSSFQGPTVSIRAGHSLGLSTIC